MYLNEIEFEGVDWFNFSQDMGFCRSPVNILINPSAGLLCCDTV